MKEKDLIYIEGCIETMQRIVTEIKENEVTIGHVKILKDIGSTILFIAVKETYEKGE